MDEHQKDLTRDNYLLLLRAFRAFDPESKGYIDAEPFVELLTTKGDNLDDAEAKAMLKFAGDTQGRIYYEDYAYALSIDGISSLARK